jgi:hypothetical protein
MHNYSRKGSFVYSIMQMQIFILQKKLLGKMHLKVYSKLLSFVICYFSNIDIEFLLIKINDNIYLYTVQC